MIDDRVESWLFISVVVLDPGCMKTKGVCGGICVFSSFIFISFGSTLAKTYKIGRG